MPSRIACSSEPSVGAPRLQKQYRWSAVRRSLALPHHHSRVLCHRTYDTAQQRAALVSVRRDRQSEPAGWRGSNPGRDSPSATPFRQLTRAEFPPLPRPHAAGPAGSQQRPELKCLVAPCSGWALRDDRQLLHHHQHCTARLHAALLRRLDARPAVQHNCPVQLKRVACRRGRCGRPRQPPWRAYCEGRKQHGSSGTLLVARSRSQRAAERNTKLGSLSMSTRIDTSS